jgi:hypothetical protein
MFSVLISQNYLHHMYSPNKVVDVWVVWENLDVIKVSEQVKAMVDMDDKST